MKNIFKKVIITILFLEARLVLLRFKPKIIAVTGSVGKTSTKDAIFTALSGTFDIRKNQKSLNSEIGVPLTILGLQNAWNDPMLWLKNIALGFLAIFRLRYPKWLVLEVGIDRPGDMAKIGPWLRPDVVVATASPKVPPHVEYFESAKAVIEEELSIITYMKDGGIVIANKDDEQMHDIIAHSKKKVLSYGIDADADVQISYMAPNYTDVAEGISLPTGLSCKIAYAGNTVPVQQNGVLGIQHCYPVAAAVATGVSQDVPLLNVTRALSQHQSPRGRMNIILGQNNTAIIDDTYNSSPLAVQRALETLAELEGNKKVAILGDMLELGQHTTEEHKRVGELVAELGITFLITVGQRAEFIAQAAIQSGMSEQHVHSVKISADAIDPAKELLTPGAVVLVKGSQGARMEKVVVGLMQNPEMRKELVVRQEEAWEVR